MLNIVLVVLLAVALSGGSGYFLSFRFWRTDYSKTNKSGDFGSPRGGFIAMLAGALIGMMFFAYVGKLIFPAETIGPALIASMISGFLGGILGLFRGSKSRDQGGNSK